MGPPTKPQTCLAVAHGEPERRGALSAAACPEHLPVQSPPHQLHLDLRTRQQAGGSQNVGLAPAPPAAAACLRRWRRGPTAQLWRFCGLALPSCQSKRCRSRARARAGRACCVVGHAPGRPLRGWSPSRRCECAPPGYAPSAQRGQGRVLFGGSRMRLPTSGRHQVSPTLESATPRVAAPLPQESDLFLSPDGPTKNTLVGFGAFPPLLRAHGSPRPRCVSWAALPAAARRSCLPWVPFGSNTKERSRGVPKLGRGGKRCGTR